MPGVADGSFGIDAARLAALPDTVVARAYDILRELDTSKIPGSITPHHRYVPAVIPSREALAQYDLIMQTLAGIDLDTLSPRAALELMWELKKNI